MLNAQQISTLRESLKTANATIADLQAKTDGQATEIGNLTGQVSTLTGENASLKTENAEIKEKLTKVESNISGKVIEGIAAAGVPPVARVPEAPGADKTDGNPQAGDGLTGLAKVEAIIAAQIAAK